jgi:hypothetical protein
MIIFVIISEHKQTKKRPLWGGFVDLVELDFVEMDRK